MSIPRHFDNFTAARANLRGVLDAAHEGLITTVVRENERFVVVAATYAILYALEEVGHEDHDVFRVAREVRRDP